MLSRVGRVTSPWKRPNDTTRKNILKKLLKTCDCEPANRIKAKVVVIPPLSTAGPMSLMVLIILEFLVGPGSSKKR